MKKGFFSKFDWAAFWAATLVTFAVYFFTLGPSVGLEDAGELATASAHLGVPHPPGYPFWTLCSWLFCKIFFWVEYMGHPTPAWAVSCCSAFFGAFAAGCTAMLICRSGRDFLSGSESEFGLDDGLSGRPADWLCFAGGVGGALAFAFSPVEWSQSTIVEIYSLNTLFLMWVFLLSYRWMRKPSDKILWFTAFVFGLGLTNYQVLLFAIVPIAIIICLKNFSMFRDFALYMMPVALTYQLLKIGELQRATAKMSKDVINKHEGLIECASTPSSLAIALALAVLVAGLVAVAVLRGRRKFSAASKTLYAAGGFAAVVVLFAGLGIFAGPMDWAREAIDADLGMKVWRADITAPLVDPKIYALVAAFAIAGVAAAVNAALCRESDDSERGRYRSAVSLGVSALAMLVAIGIACAKIDIPSAAGYAGKEFPWKTSEVTFAAIAVAMLATSLFVRRGLCFSIPVVGFHALLFVLLERGAMNGLTHPASWWFWWPVAWNFVVLALAWIVLPNGLSVAGAALCAQLGVCFYAYMPVVSDLRNPPMNWGFPRTWDGFKHAITRGQYEAIEVPPFTGPKAFFGFLFSQLSHYFADVKMQFSDFLVFFALAPFACWKARHARGRRFGALRAVGTILALLLVRAAMSAAGLGLGAAGRFIDRVLILILAVLSAVGVAMIAFRQLLLRVAVSVRRFVETSRKPGADKTKLAAFAVIVVDVFAVTLYLWRKKEGSPLPLAAFLAAVAVLAPLVASSREILRFFRKRQADGPGATFQARDITQQWLLASGACFFMMSIPLIILAKTKGDLQDGFIQKVKFIMSHAMVALWIGYGLIIVSVLLLKFAEKRPALKRHRRQIVAALVALAVLGAGVAPIVQNYADDEFTEIYGVSELVHKFGGSEQNGHTFGWQFGAYQLDGAKAIAEQLVADEEPLPDPYWPPPMDPYAIFFGGTDPGRFVPTYMIYSANFRPDVYLITQNALADDTYMAVERDLYGDEIWIPSSEDTGAAFSQFFDEVERGVRPANGELKKENGKVQVTGALGVMGINEILTEKMHRHDKIRHSFYVEESYAIPWMYPYLSPHGLIMKLNADETPYDAKTAARDRDFWDWYMKRLLRDPMYKRDFAAQKSFSKLRASIAGLYRSQNRRADAAQAYREAHLLYPPSPEATFRYVSDILLPLGRLDTINELMARTDVLDPFGRRTDRIKEYVRLIRTAERLENKLRARTITFDEQYELADTYYRLGHVAEAARFMQLLLPSLSAPDRICGAAEVFYAARRYEDMLLAVRKLQSSGHKLPAGLVLKHAVAQHATGRRDALYQAIVKTAKDKADSALDLIKQYMQPVPEKDQDPVVWLHVAKLQWRIGRQDDAMSTFARGLYINPELVGVECRRDRELYSIYMQVYEMQIRAEEARKLRNKVKE